jgi:hypothetical protein
MSATEEINLFGIHTLMLSIQVHLLVTGVWIRLEK